MTDCFGLITIANENLPLAKGSGRYGVVIQRTLDTQQPDVKMQHTKRATGSSFRISISRSINFNIS